MLAGFLMMLIFGVSQSVSEVQERLNLWNEKFKDFKLRLADLRLF